ncbi:MAG: adenylate kinase [Candidatus Burarchaeum sp.]|nr:adenylate kinase [Candidatus Burarchaeum sp.]MDO8339383.1 adenylate kinase [Candidatus Burarchaeum sp.]
MIIIMGTPGAGKSTVLSEASKDRKQWSIVNYGDLMIEIATAKGYATNRDELRRLEVAKQREVQAAVAERLAGMKGKVVLDTHCSINTPQGYYPGLPYSLLGKLKVDALVLVTAPLEHILGRRKKDTTRVRDAQQNEELAEHMRLNEAMLAAYSVLSGAPVMIVENADGKLDVAVDRLEALLDSFEA